MAEEKSPGIALLLSFLFPGIGQLYNGDNEKGIMLIVASIVSFILVFFFIGVILYLVIWIYGMIDAYQGAERYNATHRPPQMMAYPVQPYAQPVQAAPVAYAQAPAPYYAPPPQPAQVYAAPAPASPAPQPAPVYAAPVPASPAPTAACPVCGNPMTWFAQYQRWYCTTEQQYR